MRIERITDMGEIVKLVPLERKVREKNHDNTKVSDYLTWINAMINQPWFAVWIVYEDDTDRVIGYCICMIPPIKLMDIYAMNILRIWYDHHHPEAMEAMVNVMDMWCREAKVHKVRMEVTRGIKALQKKWQFKVKSICMERRI